MTLPQGVTTMDLLNQITDAYLNALVPIFGPFWENTANTVVNTLHGAGLHDAANWYDSNLDRFWRR
ncbi:hypothetical protein [Corynebacterium variabile]|uniref:hypothetical protein n=1 Tax=Corynebacterium variabile TaxID=1727 RepID=UPI003BAE3413